MCLKTNNIKKMETQEENISKKNNKQTAPSLSLIFLPQYPVPKLPGSPQRAKNYVNSRPLDLSHDVSHLFCQFGQKLRLLRAWFDLATEYVCELDDLLLSCSVTLEKKMEPFLGLGPFLVGQPPKEKDVTSCGSKSRGGALANGKEDSKPCGKPELFNFE